ncbi:helix-turn-helix transcriptional regulator [Hymenobacter negativus]|uniref:Response regulator transcription factor n=1 Tax=Hymenobacter negativus TaxID=2795026 RepID=A0ABS3QA45_9BACT|nr:LuxR C-terminal-related transcriptional regulator [Hymenobacter negativus]MBO2008111.1 response regulator transcription factor [Hymenobacter negativus]
MQVLSLHHASQLSDALAALYAQPDPATLFDRLAAALQGLFGAEAVCFDLFDQQGGARFLGAWPQHLFTEEKLAETGPLLSQHPLFSELIVKQSVVPLRTSDFVTVAQFARTDLYNHLYRASALTHHLMLAVPVPGQGLVTGALFRRRRDFTDGERILLGFVRPHVAGLLRLSQLPRRQAAPDPAAVQVHFGLTPREAEIVHQLALGRTDKEIGHWCRISPRTVQNHLQSIYAKLGVDNRTAACLRVVAGN